MSAEKAIMTVREAHRLVPVSLNAFYASIKRGEIPSLRVGRKIFIPRAAFESFLRGERASGD
jgi:excisionase family DNA binding protein